MEQLAVPQHISKVGLYTGQSFLLCFVTSVYYKFPIVCSLSLLATYFTTMLHWYKLCDTGIIKNLDIAAIINLLVTFYYNGIIMFCPTCQKAWMLTIMTIIVVYGININIFYYQTISNRGYIMKPGSYSYFSLVYTLPNTRERELSYYFSSYIHCIFLHVVISTVSIYCAVIMPHNRQENSQTNDYAPQIER